MTFAIVLGVTYFAKQFQHYFVACLFLFLEDGSITEMAKFVGNFF